MMKTQRRDTEKDHLIEKEKVLMKLLDENR